MKKYFSLNERRLMLGFLLGSILVVVLNGVFDYPLFLFFNILLATQKTRKQTVDASSKRIIGTLLGSLLGIFFYFFLPRQLWVLLLLLPLVVLCSYALFDQYVGIVGIIGLMLLVVASNGLPFHYVLWRILGAFFGVAISLLTTYILLPSEHESKDAFMKQSRQTYAAFEHVFGQIFLETLDTHWLEEYLVGEIEALRSIRYQLIEGDNDITKKDEEEMLAVISRYADVYMHLRIISRTDGILSDSLVQELEEEYSIYLKRHRLRMYRNNQLLNIHTKKLLVQWKMLEQIIG